MTKKLALLGGVALSVLSSHYLLLNLMADGNVAAVLLASGPHSSPVALVLAVLFLVFRLMTALLIPSSLAYVTVLTLAPRRALRE